MGRHALSAEVLFLYNKIVTSQDIQTEYHHIRPLLICFARSLPQTAYDSAGVPTPDAVARLNRCKRLVEAQFGIRDAAETSASTEQQTAFTKSCQAFSLFLQALCRDQESITRTKALLGSLQNILGSFDEAEGPAADACMCLDVCGVRGGGIAQNDQLAGVYCS